MRKPVALTAVQMKQASKVRPLLNAKVGMVADIEFVKADGTSSTLAGIVTEVKGADDKEVVLVETDKGYRSANVYRVVKVS